MKKLLLATAVATLAASAASAGSFSKNEENEDTYRGYECVVVQVTPPDRDRDPGYKVNVSIEDDKFSTVVHTTRSGREWDRTDQYANLKTWRAANGVVWWSGWSRKYQVEMTGALGMDKGQILYVEYVRQNGRLVTTIRTVCHRTAVD